ncbi:MAG: hypothetical protein IT340_16300 [Chloroflexi bacterium]|nr:hypothetical protein [Chloroflexota bacterium]
MQVDPVWLLMPAAAIGAWVGFRRGWRREGITAVGLALAIALLWNGPQLVLAMLNATLDRWGRIMRAIVGGEPRSDGTPIDLAPGAEPLATLGLLALLSVAAYLVGHRLGRGDLDRTGRWYGAVIGGLSLFTVMSRAVGTLTQVSPASFAATGVNLRIPSFPGLLIVVPPPPDQSLLVSWPLAALVVLLVSIMVYALLRMARA